MTLFTQAQRDAILAKQAESVAGWDDNLTDAYIARLQGNITSHSPGSGAGGSGGTGGGGGGGGGGGTYQTVKKDDFTSYADSNAFRNNSSIYLVDSNLFPQYWSIDPTVTFDGHQTLKATLPPSSPISPQTDIELGASFPKIWMMAAWRWGPGFTTIGSGSPGSAGYKIFGWGWPGYDGRGALDLTNTDQYQLSWDVRNSSTGQAIGPFANSALQSSFNSVGGEWGDGLWYRYIMCNEALTATTGRSRLWKFADGSSPGSPVLTVNYSSDSLTLPGVIRCMFGQNYNRVRTSGQNFFFHIGEWEIVDGTTYADPYDVL